MTLEGRLEFWRQRSREFRRQQAALHSGEGPAGEQQSPTPAYAEATPTNSLQTDSSWAAVAVCWRSA